MAATRSRTMNWRHSLLQLRDRRGAIELTLPSNADDAGHTHSPSLIWRVRVLDLTDEHLVVEQPAALGAPFPLDAGVQLVGIIAIGQNRWMFLTSLLGSAQATDDRGRQVNALKLALPQSVERCQRRAFYRMSALTLELPPVDAWPLLDAHSAAVAQAACRARFQTEEPAPRADEDPETDLALPLVGPSFPATLSNIGGGGVGLIVTQDHAGALNASNSLFYLSIQLGDLLPAPIAVTARLRHSHIDSAHNTHAGFAFDFATDPAHERFMATWLTRYVQRVQFARREAESD